MALGSFAYSSAVGIRTSLTNLESLNAEYVSAYRVKSSNEFRLTFDHELLSEFTRKLNSYRDSKRLAFYSRLRGSKILALFRWNSMPPKSS